MPKQRVMLYDASEKFSYREKQQVGQASEENVKGRFQNLNKN